MSLSRGSAPGTRRGRTATRRYTAAVPTPLWPAVLCLIACLAPATAGAEWRRLETPNFVVIGDASEGDLRNIAVQFEGFRETLGRVLSAKATATAVPTVVVVFPHDRAFTPYKPLYKGKPVDAAGVFYSGRDANYITLVNDVRDGRLRVLFHEYAHLMISNMVMNLPTWLNEGLAEYYSTYDPSRDGREAIIGRPIDSHLQRLGEGRLLPLHELITVDQKSGLYNEGERRSVFYAQSWALTHLLLHGEPARVNELGTFINAVRTGVAPADAWKQAFGSADLERALQQYIRGFSFKAYRYKFSEGTARVEGVARPMPQSDVSAFLAGLRIRQQRVEDAEALAKAALNGDTAHAHANVAMAQVEIAKGDHAAGIKRLTAMNTSDDWFVRYAAGTTLADSLQHERDAPVDRLAAARAHLTTVTRSREIPNALADLVRLDILGPGGTTPETRSAIERARALAPGRDDYALLHARVLAELEEFAAARSILGPLLRPDVPEHVRGTAKNWMGTILRMEERQRAMEAARTAPSPPAARPTGDPADSRAETMRLEPAFRTLENGEKRLEGTLERISCAADGAVTFHVRTASGAETLQAAKFEAVDFITFRDDLSGRISCGALKTPLPVYATWRQGPRPDARVVIAIEFLPK